MTAGPVDVEAIVIAYLEATLTDVTAAGDFPGRIVGDFIRVGRVGSTPIDRNTHRLERVRIDLDARGDGRPAGPAHGDGQAASFDLAARAINALLELNDTPFTHAAGVITGVEVELGPFRSPDPETDAERYLATVAVFAHR